MLIFVTFSLFHLRNESCKQKSIDEIKKSRKFCEAKKGTTNQTGEKASRQPERNSVVKDYDCLAGSVSKASRHSFTRA